MSSARSKRELSVIQYSPCVSRTTGHALPALCRSSSSSSQRSASSTGSRVRSSSALPLLGPGVSVHCTGIATIQAQALLLQSQAQTQACLLYRDKHRHCCSCTETVSLQYWNSTIRTSIISGVNPKDVPL